MKRTNKIAPSGERDETKRSLEHRVWLFEKDIGTKETGMELIRSLLTIAVVALLVVDVTAKLKGDECEGTDA